MCLEDVSTPWVNTTATDPSHNPLLSFFNFLLFLYFFPFQTLLADSGREAST